MRAIETLYKGCRFRSRLEARWAVFFDALQIAWRYELEGFELSDGTRYLPDFFLPKFTGGIWVEVKPEGGDLTKATRFAAESDAPVLLAEDEPKAGEHLLLTTRGALHAGEVVPYATAFNAKYLPGGENGDEYRLYDCPEPSSEPDHYGVGHAVQAARSARFEYGESG